MAAIRIDARSRPSRQQVLEAEQYPDRGNTVMPSVVHEQARAVVRDLLVTRLGPDHFVAVELTLYLLRGDSGRFLIPDLLVTLDAGQADHATGHLRKSYRIWDEGPPDLVIELASPSTVTRDNVGKKEDYAAFGIREYVQFDPLDPSDPEAPLLVPALQVWRLADGRYDAVAADSGGGVPSTVLAGLEWVQVGGLLRLRDAATGTLLPTAEEKQAMRAEAEARRAEAEARRADIEAARADAEAVARQRSDAAAFAAATRADAEGEARRRAEADLALLRAEIARLRGA